MSHSDSELNDDKPHAKRKLHIDFKQRNFKKSDRQYKTLRNRMKTLRDIRLLLATTHNHVDAVREQLVLGASPNYSDEYGRSALHIAASRGYTSIVKLLLESGADPNSSDKLSNTPLHLAACTHNLAVISLLLKAGADAKKLDIYGKNPLQLAESKLQLLQKNWREGSVEIMHLLSELKLIIQLITTCLQQQNTPELKDLDLEISKLSLNSDNTAADQVDEQMSKVLAELQGFKIL